MTERGKPNGTYIVRAVVGLSPYGVYVLGIPGEGISVQWCNSAWCSVKTNMLDRAKSNIYQVHTIHISSIQSNAYIENSFT